MRPAKLQRLLEEVDEREQEDRQQIDALLDSVPVRRAMVSPASKDEFRAARDAGDLQTQLDILFEIVTGEAP